MKNFDNYEIVRKIGEGAQGEVYLAKDKRLGRNVAIKSLHVDLITNTVLKERFIGEAKLLGQLNHPSIVCLYEYIVDSSGYHLIMEYLKGNPLDDYIKKFNGPINEIRAINIFIQVLDAISHIHIKNKLHRDIKPSNIIIDENDKVKLLDFGIAKDLDNNPNLTTVGQNVGGTPMYMSPEHISTEEINVASDIYSLGITLWQMLTGKAPYEGMSMAKIYSSIENDPLPKIQNFYPYTSKKINDIIQKATNKDPKKRYDSCKSFIRALIDLKDTLIKKDAKSKGDVNLMKNIELRVVNVQDAAFVINSVGCIGTELTYSGIPGEKLEIEIHKKGYDSISKELVINEDELIEFKLKKKIPAFISLILLIVSFFIFSFYKLVILLVNKKILKFNESKTNNLSENLDKSNASLNHNISSVKSGFLELTTLIGFILIVTLFFTLLPGNTERGIIADPVYNENIYSSDETKAEIEASYQNSHVLIDDPEIEPGIEPEIESKTELTDTETKKKYPKKGTYYKTEGCKPNSNIRIKLYHNGKGGYYKEEVYDRDYCGYSPPTTNSTPTTTPTPTQPSSNTLNTKTKSDFKKRLEKNYDYYTNNFNGWKLIIEKTGKNIEIRAYKNDKFYHKYDIKGELNDLYYRQRVSEQTLRTNRYSKSGKWKHIINLSKRESFKNIMNHKDFRYNNGDIKIHLISN